MLEGCFRLDFSVKYRFVCNGNYSRGKCRVEGGWKRKQFLSGAVFPIGNKYSLYRLSCLR